MLNTTGRASIQHHHHWFVTNQNLDRKLFHRFLLHPLRQTGQQQHVASPLMSDQIHSHSCRPDKTKNQHNSLVMNLLLFLANSFMS
jgi:hypothetical protein